MSGTMRQNGGKAAAPGVRVVVVLGLALSLAGCAAGVRPTRITTTPALAEDVDPARAFLDLARIEPVPDRPQPPADPKPLSERSERQIAQAQRLMSEQRYTEAAIELQRALRYDGDHPRIHRTLARLHWEAGNTERARTHAERAVEGNPDDAAAHYVRGRCEARASQHAAAIAAFRTAILCSDFHDDASMAALCRFHLAESLAAEGYLSAASGQYAAFETLAARVDPTPGSELSALVRGGHRASATARSNILARLGRLDEAAAALAPVAAAAPHDEEVALEYATLLTRAGRFDEALTALRRVDSDRPEVIELLEIHAGQTGRPQRVIDELRERLSRRPEDERLALTLALMLQRLDRTAEAREVLEQLLQRSPEALRARLALIELLINRSEWSAALRLAAEGIERRRSDADGLAARIVALHSDPAAVAELTRDDEKPDAARTPAAEAYLRGLLAQAAGDVHRAEQWLSEAYSASPNDVAVRVALARLYLNAARYEEALRVADRRDAQTPQDARLERLLGEVYDHLDELQLAEAHYQAATTLDRADTQSMLALAGLYHRRGEALRAQRQLRVLLDVRPDHEEAREMLARVYLDEGKAEPAIEQLTELQRRAADPLVAQRAAALSEHLRRGDAARFRQRLTEAMEQHGADAATWLAVAESYDADEEAAEQYAAFRQALSLNPDHEEAAMGLVGAAMRLLRFEEAAERLAALARRRPNRHAWRLGARVRVAGTSAPSSGLIELLLAIGDFDEALRLAREGEAHEDLDEITRRRYRRVILDTLRAAQRDDELIDQLKRWAGEEPGQSGAAMMLAQEYVQQNQPSKAAALLKELHRSDPSDRQLRIAYARALSLADRPHRAAQVLLDWFADDPERDEIVHQLVFVFQRAEWFDDALELIHNQLLNTYDRQQFQNRAIAVLADAERLTECRRLIERLLDEVLILFGSLQRRQPVDAASTLTPQERANRPNEPLTLDGLHRRLFELRFRLVEAMLAAKAFREAEREVLNWLEDASSPRERFEYLRWLAFVYRAMGQDDEATDTLAKALLLQPENLTLNNDVAYGWIERGIALHDAERMIRYALARAPTNSAFLDTYGWLLYKQGQFAEAQKWLLRSLRLRGTSDPVILDHLGDTAWRLGDVGAAIEYWTRALEATQARDDDVPVGADEQRVRELGQRKIDDARARRQPPLSPLAATDEKANGPVGKPNTE